MHLKNQNKYHKLAILDGLEILVANHHAHNFPFHTHDTFNITLVLEQSYTTKISNRFLYSPAGSIVVTSPGEVHATFCDNRIGSSFFTFYVLPDVLAAINKDQSVTFENNIINDPVLFRQLFTLADGLNQPVLNLEAGLMHSLERLVRKHSTPPTAIYKSSTTFRRFLEEEPFEKFSLENAAHKLGLDKFKYLRLFKYETGLTPNNYIILKRIEKSKQLLQTNNDLLDIAIKTGFYDATHLCKYFKKITGISPLTYRNA